jgi:branched-chain amino acid transport system permease protein
VSGLPAFLNRHRLYLLFSLVMLAFPLVVTDRYYLSVLAFMATQLMTVVGLNLLMGQAGQISLGHAAFVGLGAYGAAILTTRYGMDPWLAMGLAAVLAGAVAAVIGGPTLRLKGHYLAMATLAFGEIVWILLIQLKGITSGTDGIIGIPSLSLGPLDFGEPRLYHVLAWGVALVLLRIALNLTRSRPGRALRALHWAEVAAGASGVDTARQKVKIFVLSAVFASLAGSFYAYNVLFISPDSFSLNYSVLLVTSVVIGGLGSVWGAVWGTFVLALLPEVLKQAGDGAYQDYTNLIFGLLLIVIMIFLPGGIVSWRQGVTAARRRWETARGRRGAPETREAESPDEARTGEA